MTTAVIVATPFELSNICQKLKRQGKTIGFVPTMGALHAGHLSLVNLAKKFADCVVVSIFVNPAQFSKKEDLARYPRNLESDLTKLQTTAVDYIYTPAVKDIYPNNFTDAMPNDTQIGFNGMPNATNVTNRVFTQIAVPSLSHILCGAMRPQHFDGVCLIVTKLFMQVLPDVAIFGEKDFQQLTIIKKMVADLNIPVQIIAAPTARITTGPTAGLALSSRNQYLNQQEILIAPAMYRILTNTANLIRQAKQKSKKILTEFPKLAEQAKQEMLDAGFNKIEYLEWRSEQNLVLMNEITAEIDVPSRLLAAAWLGTTRLIDNVVV